MKPRVYDPDRDYFPIREFVQRSYGETSMHWEVLRWEGQYDPESLRSSPEWQRDVGIWQTDDHTILGVVVPEGPGDYHFLVGEDSRAVEPAMVEWAEARHALHREGNANLPRAISIWAADGDVRCEILAERGYRKTDDEEKARERDLAVPIMPVVPPEGYTVRQVTMEDEDLARLVELDHRCFPRSGSTPEGLRRFPSYRSYRSELNLAVEGPDGSYSAFCIVWIDEMNKVAIFEPVGTHPEHRRKGLAKAVMTEGLRRAVDLGARSARVGSFSEAAARTYESVGFGRWLSIRRWERDLGDL